MSEQDNGAKGALSLAELLDTLGIGVFRIEADTGKVLWGSEGLAQLMGYASARELEGASALDHYADPKERKEALTRFFGRADAARPKVLRVEAQRKRHDDGAPIDVRMNIAPRYDSDGTLKLLEGTMEGIGAPSAAIEKAFEQSEERFRVVFEDAAIGMVITDTEGRILRLNRACCHLLGEGEAQLLGQDIQQLLDRREEQRRLLSLADGDDEAHATANEFVFSHKSGRRIWAYVSCCWLRDTDQVAHSAVLMLQDISSRRRAEEALLRLDKLESIALLAGGIAHDFNNVLTGIAGNISLARASVNGAGDDAAKFLESAEQSTLRAQSLTAQLLTFARGGAPKIRPTCIKQLVADAAAFCLRGAGVDHAFEAPSQPWPVHCDGGQISQVLHNLIINAKQAMGTRGTVRIDLQNLELDAATTLPLDPGRYLRVGIVDTGHGIPADDLPRIFDPYFSTKEEGNGLGLATSHSIILRHGGHIDVSSEPGVGTRFDVYLRAAPERAPLPTSPEDAPTALDGRVLVMDDEEPIRETVAVALTQIGVEVSTAADGAEAVGLFARALEQGRGFDAVILDLTVPGGLGGLEIIPRMKQLDSNVRAIVSSGYASNDVMASYGDHGFAAALAKPYSIEQLKKVVAPFLTKGS